MSDGKRCLQPYHRDEAVEVCWAAFEAEKDERTVRNWCHRYSIGRRNLAGGHWTISRVAFAMFLDGNLPALNAYLAGQRQSDPVAPYYHRVGLGHLLDLPEFKQG